MFLVKPSPPPSFEVVDAEGEENSTSLIIAISLHIQRRHCIPVAVEAVAEIAKVMEPEGEPEFITVSK